MIVRQRLLVALLADARRPPTPARLITWLFLLRDDHPAAIRGAFYEFIPGDHGPSSFQAERDLAALQDAGVLEEEKLQVCEEALSEADALPEVLRTAIKATLSRYGRVSDAKLRTHIAEHHPWYAPVPPGQTRRRSAKRAVYTVGYEGRSIDGLLDRLLRAGIRQLVDVRKNAMSRKYGFGGKTIARLCADVDIDYVHVPDLGIPGSMRKSLKTDDDFQRLFDEYEASILPEATASIERVAELCRGKASALMCFEATSCACHRGRLAPKVAAASGLTIEHL